MALGEQVFGFRCTGCHAVGSEGAKDGPDLNNLIGRPAASLEGFEYSDAMVEAGQRGVVWDIETLSQFITKPRSVSSRVQWHCDPERDTGQAAARHPLALSTREC